MKLFARRAERESLDILEIYKLLVQVDDGKIW